MDHPKYVVVMKDGCECAIIFSSLLNHHQVAGTWEVVGAGFCRLPDRLNDNVSAWGESKTLRIKSRGDKDAEILRYVCPQE